MKRKGTVFVDANILIHAASYQSADVFHWIDSVYDEIIIHQAVMEELVLPSVRDKVESYHRNGKWKIFNPDREEDVSDDLFSIYEVYLQEVRAAFRALDVKKQLQERPVKNTNDIGEIHSLAAAMLLDAKIICSNDYDIREVIEDTPILVNNQDDSVLLEHDTLLDFCHWVVKFDVESRKSVRKFVKVIIPERLNEFDLKYL